MNRRSLFSAAVAGVMLPGAVLVSNVRTSDISPDADLIATCTEFDACERKTSIIHGTGPECVVDDDEANVVSAPIFTRMRVLLNRMDELRAMTPAVSRPGRTASLCTVGTGNTRSIATPAWSGGCWST